LLLQLNDLDNLLVREAAFRLHQLLTLLGVAIYEAGVDLTMSQKTTTKKDIHCHYEMVCNA
jgi:hypothetical protein